MTNRLNRLEEVGSIVRVADPDDKRSMLVALSEEGLAMIEQALLVHAQTQNSLLETLDASQQTQLKTLLSQLLVATEAER
jgi:cytochrome b561